jgi:tetratricopeptide (TPR) repeat protein
MLARQHLATGDQHASKGQVETAVPHYELAVSLLPSSVPAQQRLCQALSQLNRVDEAVTCCISALKAVQADGHGEAFFHGLLGETLASASQPLKAARSFRRAAALHPARAADMSLNAGLSFRTAGRHVEAAASLRAAARLTPRDAATHMELASTLDVLGQLPEAATTWRRATRLAPTSLSAHGELGHALLATGRAAEAAAAHERALALAPRLVEGYFGLAQARLGMREPRGAHAAFLAAAGLAPSDAETLHAAAMAAWGRADGQAEAAHLWRRALAVAPGRADSLTMLRGLEGPGAAAAHPPPPLSLPPRSLGAPRVSVEDITVAMPSRAEAEEARRLGGGSGWVATAARRLATHGALLLTGVLSEEGSEGLRLLLKQVAASPQGRHYDTTHSTYEKQRRAGRGHLAPPRRARVHAARRAPAPNPYSHHPPAPCQAGPPRGTAAGR